ncbi:hypothetical protein SUGI_0233480 [Cryptomeria japonica]|uniref:uncharacterized protein LOC131074398 n=1 Tax=Cryptomeria japonica TaxID=3369 RepID=UPI002408B6EB|nr:uncharacterized protein LOC131074398 [Cryptomeria japonica]GLJ14439.1 hypothetical protein SUGI_0233480 [Cryptomeria japonica]
MASYSIEDFVGNGVLKEVMDYLVSEGWDDVPTLKMMNVQDMEAHSLTAQQRDALEIRSYLHNRSLMEYADVLEASGKSLPELLSTDPRVLSSQCGMKRGHVARFMDRSVACGVPMPPNMVLPARKKMNTSTSLLSEYSISSTTMMSSPNPAPSPAPPRPFMSRDVSFPPTSDEKGIAMRGIVAAAPTDPRCCGLVKPPYLGEDVVPYTMIEGISVKKLTPDYKVGMEAWAIGELKTPPPMKAGDLWLDKPAVVLCIRRPGCVMCRAEAHQIYARKPIFDALGFQLIAVLHEFIDSEVKEFWPRYWGGIVVVDTTKDFFRALGGGKLPKEGFITGFIFNKNAIENYKRAKATGIPMNYKGEGTIKGGMFVMGSGKTGVAYQFVERNFGDSAPLAEVIEVCNKLQNNKLSKDQRGLQL